MKQLNSINPCNGETVWCGRETTTDEIPGMVSSARMAFPQWSAMRLADREGILENFHDIVSSRTDRLSKLIAREIGKPLWEAKTEVSAMAAKVEISILAHRERCAKFSGGKAVTRFRPHGVMAVIGPYNFPGHLPNGHICPALLAGNTVLFKPSELAPGTGEFLVQCWHQAGLPDNVLQIVQGGADVSRQLVAQPDLNGVFFTGSAQTGKALLKQFSDAPGKILALEMGGNNPLIVDAANIDNLEAAVEITVKSAFISAGQRCTCARRLVVIRTENAGRFMDLLLEKTRGISIGDPLADPQPFMGPLASSLFPEKILEQQNDLIASGASALLKAARLDAGHGFLSPAILDVSEIENLPDEEIFGPVLLVQQVSDLEQAIRVANATDYGLASGILTDKEAHYRYAYPRLQAGIINWNTQLTGASSAAPFGGIKNSGNHRPSAFFAADYCSYPVASIESPRCGAG